MTLAVALAEAGTLSRHGLLCASCDKNPKRRDSLGCGRPPQVTIMTSRGRSETISLTREWVEAEAAAAGVAPSADFWARWYRYAGLGHIESILGETWDCCPRYYSELAPLAGRILAAEAVAAARDMKRGVPLGREWQSPSERGQRILRAAVDARDWIKHDRDEEAKNSHQPDPHRRNRR